MDKTAEIYSQPETEKLQKGNERILIVDDEEAVAKLEKQMLERLGYNVTCRFHSLEALEVFKVKPFSFDLINFRYDHAIFDRGSTGGKGISRAI